MLLNKKYQPLISVIIPTFNRGYTINKTIKSVINQTYKNLEIIIVDDGSTDDTQKVVKNNNDKRIKYLRHKKNKGGSAARNTGIKHSHGKYIAFLDSDDLFFDNKLEKQFNILNNLSSQYAGICCNTIIKTNFGSFISDINQEKTIKRDLIYKILSMDIKWRAGSTLMIRKNIIKDVGFWDETFPRHQDYEFLIKIIEKYKIFIITEPLVTVTRDITSNPSANTLEKAKNKFLNKFEYQIKNFSQHQQKNIRKKQWLSLCKAFFREKRIGKAFSYLLKALREKSLINPSECIKIFICFIDGTLNKSIYNSLLKLKFRLHKKPYKFKQ